MSILQQPAKLHRYTYILVWIQAVLGCALFAGVISPLATVFAALSVVALVCVHTGKRRGARIVARVIISLFWLLVAMLTTQFIATIDYGFTAYTVQSLQDGVCWFGGPFLCFLAPTATAAMLYQGNHTAGYDRLMACLVLPAQIGVAYVAIFTEADIPWLFGENFLPYAWLALTALCTIAVWISARVRTPEQQEVIDRRRAARKAAHEARIEKRKNGASIRSHR